jgi:hypothetical protein
MTATTILLVDDDEIIRSALGGPPESQGLHR